MATNVNHVFPHVAVRERIVGPVPFTSYWRNTIGIAGVFSRGPLIAAISNREDLVSLYGEDESSGSLFVKSAMLQGATNFIISRVMPSASSGEGTIFLQPDSNPVTAEAFVGTGATRTIGLTFSTSYIGSVFTDPGVYLGTPVTIPSTSQWAINTSNVSATFRLRLVENVRVANISGSPSGNITVSIPDVPGATTSTIRKITAVGAHASRLKELARPGLVLTGTGFSASADKLNAAGSHLVIESYAFSEASGTQSVLVRGTATAGSAVVVTIAAATSNDYMVFSHMSVSEDGNLIIPGQIGTKTYSKAGSAESFMTIAANDKTAQMISLLKSDGNGGYVREETGVEIVFGDPTNTDPTEIVPGSTFMVPVVSASVTVGESDPAQPNSRKAFDEGLAASEVLKMLRDAMYRSPSISSLIKDATLNDQILPHSLSFQSVIEGAEANRISYTLDRIGTDTDLLYEDNGSDLYGVQQTLLNGSNGMTSASRFLYDVNGRPIVYIEAISPGITKLKVTVRPSPPGQFRLEVVDESAFAFSNSAKSESFMLSNYGVDKFSGMYLQTASSNLIRAYFVPVAQAEGEALPEAIYNAVPMRLAPPSETLANSDDIDNVMHPAHKGVLYLKDVPLLGGSTPSTYNPRSPREQDYIAAINRLESADCAIISCDNVDVNDIRYESAVTELVSQAERSTTMNGLRIAVVAAPKGLTAGRANYVAQGLSSSKVVIVAGWASLPGRRTAALNSVSPTGIYAGKLAVIEPHVSPASASEAGMVLGVESVDSRNTPEYLNALTTARIEVLHLDTATGAFKFLNGLTSGLNSNDKYVSIRRMANQIIMDLYRNLQWARSASHTPELRRRIASACDAYMTSLVREGRINGFKPSVCDGSNNTQQTVGQGQLYVRISYSPIYPADFIYVDLIRDVTEDFSVSVSS